FDARRHVARPGDRGGADPGPAVVDPVLAHADCPGTAAAVRLCVRPVPSDRDVRPAGRPQAAPRLVRRTCGRADRAVGHTDPAGRRLPRPRPQSVIRRPREPLRTERQMHAIARSELVQILRNRSVLVTGLVMPLAVSAYFIYF